MQSGFTVRHSSDAMHSVLYECILIVDCIHPIMSRIANYAAHAFQVVATVDAFFVAGWLCRVELCPPDEACAWSAEQAQEPTHRPKPGLSRPGSRPTRGLERSLVRMLMGP